MLRWERKATIKTNRLQLSNKINFLISILIKLTKIPLQNHYKLPRCYPFIFEHTRCLRERPEMKNSPFNQLNICCHCLLLPLFHHWPKQHSPSNIFLDLFDFNLFCKQRLAQHASVDSFSPLSALFWEMCKNLIYYGSK